MIILLSKWVLNTKYKLSTNWDTLKDRGMKPGRQGGRTAGNGGGVRKSVGAELPQHNWQMLIVITSANCFMLNVLSIANV